MKQKHFMAFIMVFVLIASTVFIGGCDTQSTVGQDRDSQPIEPVPSAFLRCGDDLESTFVLDITNKLNETGEEPYDNTVYVLNKNGQRVTTITDTSAPTGITLDCGYEYMLKIVAADGASGDNSQFVDVVSQPQDSVVELMEDGSIKVIVDRPNFKLNTKAEQHGTMEFKLYDNQNSRFAYDTGDTDNTVFEADGVTFTNGDNSTAFALTDEADFLDLRLEFRGVEGDTDPMDHFMYIGVIADINTLDEPQLTYKGSILDDISSELVDPESKALNSYDYVYKITNDIEDKIQKLEYYQTVLTGQNPTADVQIDFFPAGNYLSADGKEIKTGSHKDNTARDAVFTTMDVTIDVS